MNLSFNINLSQMNVKMRGQNCQTFSQIFEIQSFIAIKSNQIKLYFHITYIYKKEVYATKIKTNKDKYGGVIGVICTY